MVLGRRQFDAWLMDSPVSGRDLSLFRIVYAFFVLLTVYRADYAAFLPPAAFDPPVGPFAVLGGAPPAAVIWLVQAALCMSLATLAIGWRTRFSALAVGVLQIVLYGIGYSFGKIDHTIFLPFVALLLAFSAWGSSYSVDSRRDGADLSGSSWVPRCLAVALGVGMLTAGLSKVHGGWLDWSSQATYGYAIIREDVLNTPLDGSAMWWPINHPVLWELMDYATIVMECGVILAALSWRLFYVALAGLSVFHVIARVVLGILFPYNLMVYAAFVPWSRWSAVPVDRLDRLAARLASSLWLRAAVSTVIASVGLLLVALRPEWFVPTVYLIAILIAGAIGLGYLVSLIVRARPRLVRQ